MRIAALQINSLLGAASANRKKLFEMYVAAAKDGADIAIAPEAALTGYPLEDLVLRESFLEGVSKEREGLIQDILDSGYFTAFVFGSPRHNNSIIHNSAYFVDPWTKTVQLRDKQELPNYGVFDEKRVYRAGGKNSPIEWRKYKIGLMICEDWWHSRVAEQLKDSDFIIIINGSPYEDNKINTRREISVERFNEIKKPFVYVNLVGGQDELVFDGQSFLYDGESLQEAASFKEGIYIFEIDLDKEKVLPNRIHINRTAYDLADTYRALVLGTRDYLYKLGFSDSLLGYSGGVDSGLVGAISCDAIRPEHTHLVRLPSNFSSPESLTDAAEGAKRLGADMLTMHIESVANAIRGTFALGPNVYDPERPKQELTGVADENIQARARGLLLMALSNQFGWMLLTTGNKSEMSVGYCVDGNTLISTDDGVFNAKTLYNNYKTKTIKGNKIIDAFETKRKIKVKIYTKQGQTLICGTDHPLKTYDPVEEKFKFIKCGNLEGNEILIGSQFFCDPKNEWFPIINFIKKEWDFKSPSNLTLPTKIDKELAIFIGICVADGSFSQNGRYRITTKKQEVIDFCSKVLAAYNVSFTINEEERITRIDIFSVEFCSWLKDIGVNHLTENKEVPEVIFRNSKEIIKYFLSGVLLDSSLNSKKNTTEMCFNAKSYNLAQQIYFLMGSIGVRAYLRPLHNRNSVYVPSCEQYKLLSLKEKNQIIMNIQDDNRIKPKAGLDNIYYTKKELEEIKKEIPWYKRGSIFRSAKKTYSISLAWVVDKVKKGYLDKKWLKEETRYLTIEKIEIEQGEFTMYDFTVENIEQYEANGFTVHNCTLYGDMSGGFNPIKDVYKTKVWDLCRWRNDLSTVKIEEYGFFGKRAIVVPESIIAKPPSAELRLGQKDEDSLPPYPILDLILECLIEKEMSVADTVLKLRRNYGEEFVNWPSSIRKKVDIAEYKRRQGAPGVKISPRIYGRDRRYPIVNRWSE